MVVLCLCAGAVLLSQVSSAGGATYFGATISGETYGQATSAPINQDAWNQFERHAGKKVAILLQGQSWITFDKAEMDATRARGAIPLVTMGLGPGLTLDDVVSGSQDAAIKKWAQEAKAWGHPFMFAPWWEMNGGWYAWGRSPNFIPAWRHFHQLVSGQGATNVTWTWTVNSIWFDPESDPRPYYPGDEYVDWAGLDSYNWGLNLAQPDRWLTPQETFDPTLDLIKDVAGGKPIAIVETASSELGGNKADWIRETLTTYLPHHPEIKAFLWFNWPFQKNGQRHDWPIESSAPAQQQFRKAIQSSLFRGGPVALPPLTKVPPPPAAVGDPPQPLDLSASAELAGGPEMAVAADGTAIVVWSARSGGTFVVFTRQIAPDGTPLATRQLSAPGGDALAPSVALGPDGTATVAWIRFDGASFRAQARQIAPDGTPAASTLDLSKVGQHAVDPKVAVGLDGTATVVWNKFNDFNYLIDERRIFPDGSLESTWHTLSAGGGDAVEPDVATGPSGASTVVWSRHDGADSIVQERRIEASGTPVAAAQDLSAAGESAIGPQVSTGPGGVANVVWTRFDGANWIVQGQRLTAAGAPEETVESLSLPGRSAVEPQLATAPDGTTTTVWDRYDGSNFIVQARRLDPTGNLTPTTFNLSASGRDAGEPEVAVAPNGTATVLWSRFDGAHFILQRRDLTATGSLGSVEGLSAAGRNANEPALAWGADGTLAMAWRRATGGGDVVQAKTVPLPAAQPPPAPPLPPPPASSSRSGSSPATEPASDFFRIGKVRFNRKRGTALVSVEVSGPGELSLRGAVPQRRQATGAGTVTLRVVPRAKKRRVLDRVGSLRLRVVVSFEPHVGAASSRGLTLRLKRTLRG